MKTFMQLVVVGLCLVAGDLSAQDIEAQLSGDTHNQGFTVKSNSGSPLFSVRGNRTVGIGTITPQRPLHMMSPTTSNELIMEVQDGMADWKKWNFLVNGGTGNKQNFHLRILNDATTASSLDAMTWTSAGRVGVNIPDPQTQLHVGGAIRGDHVEAVTNLDATVTPADGGQYKDNVVYAWADIAGNGSIISSYGFTSCSRISEGRYSLTWKKSLSARAISVTPYRLGNEDAVTPNLYGVTSTGCNVEMVNIGAGNDYDAEFSIIVVGRP